MASSIFRGFGVQTNQANTWTANQTFSGRILISDGLVGAPSLAYINNPLTGFYNEGANVLSITNNGTRYHRFGIGSYLLLADSAVIALGLSSDVTMTRAAARVLVLGPTTGVRLSWTTDGSLLLRNFADSANGNFEAALIRGSSFQFTATSAIIRSGTNTPEGAVVGSVGDLFLRTNGGAGTTLYIKESGAATNTGWVAK
jgi:hypothetical protein